MSEFVDSIDSRLILLKLIPLYVSKGDRLEMEISPEHNLSVYAENFDSD